jgi:RNA polymerase sigma-70 factor, ECF subfamily
MKLSREQFEKLALEHLDTLYRVARRLCRDHNRAEDLVQETYLRALHAADTFRLEEFGIRPWLLRIMHNLYVSRAEREKGQPHLIDEQQLDAIADSTVFSTAGAAMFDSMDEQLVAALEELPNEYKQVILLWAVGELSYKEISSVLGVPMGTIMSRLHRARERLSSRLQDYAQKEGLIRE